ncbi:nose resistant to fluoxetine protein 6-like isoform X2 [Leptopilina boulardi]|uniref:nose resistant to fluoxetine protein 6-like isoform X2 n=1 Tax=Leptopilina boulardi TaxID=63433 RepID=UPI0021F57F42|nr:nose resistant to fluoxetine protein 6-like isoform X2 [Leptopilina boulardi]
MKFFQKTVILLVIKLTLVLLCFISSVKGNLSNHQNNTILNNGNIQIIFNNLEAKNILNNYSKFKLNKCSIDIYLLIQEVKKLQPWALSMIDASTKIPSGLLQGNVVDLGMFDECINIHGNLTNKRIINGRHCIYTLNFLINNVVFDLKPKFGMCLPSSCDIEDVVNIIDNINEELHKKGISETINIQTEIVTCSYLNNNQLSTGSIIFISILTIIVLFLVICTILELLHNWLEAKNYNWNIIRSLSRFSLINSSLRILSLKMHSGSISSIHGIRALSILWIVYGHDLFFNVMASFVNSVDFLDWAKSWRSFYLAMGIYAVDTFFLLSGFLLSYLFFKKMAHGKTFNILEFYFHRYIRLTPALAALVLITIFIVPHLGSGPRWEGDIVANVSTKCENSWWKILLYVQNYAGENIADNLFCLGHLWYLSVDMQLFWLSPLIIYPLAKKPKIGLIILGLAFFASIITPAVIVGKYELLFTSLNFNEMGRMAETANKYYVITHCRASPWITGIFFGYIMVTKKSKPNRKIVIFGWIVAIICFIFCTWGHLATLRNDYVYNVVLETVLASLGHFIWATGVAWIIYACHHGSGGLINKLLSLSIFLPISKISYSLYLLHYLFQNLKSGSSRLSSYFSDFGIKQRQQKLNNNNNNNNDNNKFQR